MAKYFADLTRTAIEANGFDVITIKNHPRSIIRAWVDREPGGVSVQDCIDLVRKIREHFELDGLDPGDFTIEVQSPGMDRLLVRDRDFERFAGKEIRVRLKDSSGQERRNYKGVLVGLSDGKLTVRGENEWSFDRRDLDEVRLVPEVPPGFEAPTQAERGRKPRKARRKRPMDH